MGAVDDPSVRWNNTLDHLKQHPHDSEGWRNAIAISQENGILKEIAETYQTLLHYFPNTPWAQIEYIRLLEPTKALAADLGGDKLIESPFVESWELWLEFVRAGNSEPQGLPNTLRAFETVLYENVGHDKASGRIWRDYIQSLKSAEICTTDKIVSLRNAYHAAVQIPIDNMEELWSELVTYEYSLDAATAPKILATLLPLHMRAKAVHDQLQLCYPTVPSPLVFHLPSLPLFTNDERALVGAWKRYLKWEVSNPLNLPEKKVALVRRVQNAYRKAVVYMRFYPEIWYMSYIWHASVGLHIDALKVLGDGVKANPTSFILNFAYAELGEQIGNRKAVYDIFENLIGALRAQLDSVKGGSDAIVSSIGHEPANTTTGVGVKVEKTGDSTSLKDQMSNAKTRHLQDRRTAYGIAWIQYMRVAGKMESRDLAHAIFARAKKDPWTPWNVYDATAMREYHLFNDADMARKIYESGVESFGKEPAFLLRYLEFLISVNDDQNAHGLFDAVICKLPPDLARPLWNRWMCHEYECHDLKTVQKLHRRMTEVFPSDSPIQQFAKRYTYHGTDIVADWDLGLVMARKYLDITHSAAENNSTERANPRSAD